jgi:hypothetical protein
MFPRQSHFTLVSQSSIQFVSQEAICFFEGILEQNALQFRITFLDLFRFSSKMDFQENHFFHLQNQLYPFHECNAELHW